MVRENGEIPDVPVEIKINAVKEAFSVLGLESLDADGGNIAALIDHLIGQHGDDWKAEFDNIIGRASSLINSGRVQEAMFYLGDIINEIGRAGLPPRQVARIKQFNEESRAEWDPSRRLIAGTVSSRQVPRWMTRYEMENDPDAFRSIQDNLREAVRARIPSQAYPAKNDYS